MKRRRMKFSSRFMALLLCAAMMLTSVWNENLVVQAAPDTYYSEDVVTAGDTNLVPDAFAYDGGWTNSTFTSGAVESVDVDGSAGFKVSIAEGALGGSDWGHGFKYTGTYGGNATLTNGTSYLVSFKANSTVERKIQTGCDTGQQTTRETIQLQEGDNDISYVMNAGVDWGNFYFYCGLVDSSETDYGTHEITIWDFSIKEATITPVDGETVEETEGNLITNGTFAENADGWTIENNGYATVSKVPYRVVFDITQDVADYLTWMFWNFDAASLKSGSTYNVKMDVVSSVDRKLTVGFDDGGGRQEPKSVKANEKTTLEWNISYTGGTKFAIFLGSNILAPYAENQALGAHRISVSNVRFVETSGSTGGTESGGDTDTDTTTAATEAEKTELQTAITAAQEIETAGNEDGTYTEKSWTALTDAIDAAEAVLAKEEPTSSEVNTALANLNAAKEGLVEAAKAVEAAIGNLLVNGNFENGVTSWRQLGGPWTIEPYYVTCQIAQGSADWEGFLGQTVTLEANTDYVLAFDVKSTVARKLYAGFDGHATYSNLGVKDVPANTLTTVKYELNAASGVTGEFSLFLGNNIRNTEYTQADIPAHSITISNVRIVPKDLDGVTYDDPAPASYIAQLKTAYEEGATMVDAGQELLYSETSWKAYTDAIANAKTLLEKDGATVREVFDAIDALKEAKDGLVEEIPTDLEGTIIDFNDVEKNE